jgi:hypothetical protein
VTARGEFAIAAKSLGLVSTAWSIRKRRTPGSIEVEVEPLHLDRRFRRKWVDESVVADGLVAPLAN